MSEAAWGLGFLFLLLHILGCRSRVRLVVADHRLPVEITGPLESKRWEWALCGITRIENLNAPGFAAETGLRVTSGERVVTLLSDCKAADLAYVAELLQCAIFVNDRRTPPDVPAMDGEISVTFARRSNEPLAPGFLRCERGSLTLRYAFPHAPEWRFIAAHEWTAAMLWRVVNDGVYRLTPDDVNCRDDGEGWGEMRIARFEWPAVKVSFWCDDKEALHDALARFWGARD